MDKRHKEMLSALVKQLRHLLLVSPSRRDDAPLELTLSGHEQGAWTWMTRLLLLRALEVRGLLLRTPEDVAACVSPGCAWWEACQQARRELATLLPDLFPSDTSLQTRNLFPCIDLIIGQQPVVSGKDPAELTRLFADPDLLGWAYQFYQHEARTKINAKCRRGEKVVSRAELVAKTQIFTEEYIVDWLLQNSLGRCYREAYPRSSLPASWPYAFTPDESDGPPERVWPLEELTLLDPCMGCGHFLRAAFDLLVAMYREQYPHMSMTTLVERVFARHLFGIDLDPQAVQIGKLTLLLRAWELLSVEYGAPTLHVPPLMHLTTIPSRLTPGSLERHLQRFPEDLPYQAYLDPIFTGLEQIDLLGSLLCLHTRLEEAADETCSDSHLPLSLLEHLAASCAAEEMTAKRNGLAGDQVGSLLYLLNRKYTVVATNPPYLDSRDMQEALRMYIAAHYQAGKRDLYTAFMLRCLDLCQAQGRLALVTMQSWMFNRSFAELRAGKGGQTDGRDFGGLLRATSIEALVHLGAHSFEEIAGQIVQCAMFVFLKRPPREDFCTRAWRLVGLKSAEEKRAALLKTGEQNPERLQSRARQGSFLALREAPLVYYLSDDLMRLLTESETLESIAHVRQGLATAENARFTRCFWEIAPDSSLKRRWFRYARGGSYRKWAGLMWMVVDWEYNGQRIKLGVDARNRPRFRDNAPKFAFQPGLTYTFIASGCFGSRILEKALFDVAGTSLFPRSGAIPLDGLAAVTSTRVVSYFLRVLTQDLKFNPGYVSSLPLPQHIPWARFQAIGAACITLKKLLVAQEMTEDTFMPTAFTPMYQVQAVLHALEGWNELAVCELYRLSTRDRQAILAETGTPAGWYPLAAGYDALPDLADEVEDAPALPSEFSVYLAAHARIAPAEHELRHLKSCLRRLYAAGPRARKLALPVADDAGFANQTDDETGACLPIPGETFLEELSCRLRIHPISVYWLLEELRATTDARCLPEERRLLEDRLSVLVLRLLGYHWPAQVEHGESLPAWAESSGLIPLSSLSPLHPLSPLVPDAAQDTLAERVRARWQAEEGVNGALQLERLLLLLTGQDLERWLRTSFFERHIVQFKQRPIAWHLASTPLTSSLPARKRSACGGNTAPAFACLLSYHSCTDQTLTTICTRYIEPLIAHTRLELDDETPATSPAPSSARARLRELETFAARLRTIAQEGFACRELREILDAEERELADDGMADAAEAREEQWSSEAAWRVDLNDGVRVNIAPLQLAGVLARDVLQAQDARKALADRARWRSEERRWVRAGKLPRCGWSEQAVIDSWPDQSRHASAADQRAGTGAGQ